jgi:hypothetical protein
MIEVNLDLLEVVNTMQNGGNSISVVATVYEEFSFLARNFTHVKFDHRPRERNFAAHTLACNAEGPQSIVWHEDPPNFLLSLL